MTAPRWLPVVTSSIAVVGLGVAAYLTLAHFTSPDVLACSDSGFVNCARVTTSKQSSVLGIPIVLPGLAWWIAMLALSLPVSWRSENPWVHRARLTLALAGMAFVLWLLYVEFVILHGVCAWCSVIHVLTFVMFAIVAIFGIEPALRSSRRPR
ncbi:MAG: vitamin K epoxide reductase family protein [Planctomycetaceae bacterium]